MATGVPGLPPDPASVAPPLDGSVATSLISATSFLYTGPNPIQTGVSPGTITITRTAVLRGKVMTRDGQPLPGATIAILDHPEFGQTLSRADGLFDLAVNGGGLLTVTYQKHGYLPAQRQVQTPWQDYAALPDVALVPLDPRVTTVDLSSGSSAPIQVAQGSVISDTDGQRQATLLFARGTTATMTLPDGSVRPLPALHVRATEYTVGANGPAAMPGQLPPSSGYTYAAEFSVDEATAAGAISVTFSQPVNTYVTNFLGFPTGTVVPAGYYDRLVGRWVGSGNGLVIGILGVTGGEADLDLDGSGTVASASALGALGITDAERQQLAALYAPGQSLWRVPVTHFTPWDYNWPFGPPPDATAPNQPPPDWNKPPVDDPCQKAGSIIGCETQSLGEEIGVTDTPFRLRYQSERQRGFSDGRTLSMSLSGDHIPHSLKSIDLSIQVAGQFQFLTFPPATNLRHTFNWDGRDGYGRSAYGAQPVSVNLCYNYGGYYYASGSAFAASFALSAGGSGGSGGSGGGGSNVSIGRTRQIDTVAGISTSCRHDGDGGLATQTSLSFPVAVAVGPDGSLYIIESGIQTVRRVRLDGIITTVAGDGTVVRDGGGAHGAYGGDGGPATAAQLNDPGGIALGPDGSLYIADTDNNRVRRVGPDGVITTVAGDGNYGFSGDGGPSTQARFFFPTAIAVGPDGSLYVADLANMRIRKISTDGVIATVAGTGVQGYAGDEGPAAGAQLNAPYALALAPDGAFVVADTQNNRIRRVAPAFAGLSLSDIVIPSQDRSEIYIFDAAGRHLRTLDAHTNAVRYRFGYDGSGRLVTVTDGDGNVTTIEHDAAGHPTAIVAPGGQLTTLTTDANGYLSSVADPLGETTDLTSTTGGLLTGLQDPNDAGHHFSYDEGGRLTRDADPAGSVTTLTRTDNTDGYTVTLTTALGRTTAYGVGRLPTGGTRRVVVDPSGGRTEVTIGADGAQAATYPDSTRATLTQGPDPRWGMLAPMLTGFTRTTPGGLTTTAALTSAVELSDPADLFSVQGITDTATVNGRTSTSVYDAASRTTTTTTPGGRRNIVTLDDHGRATGIDLADGVDPIALSYDALGRVSAARQGAQAYTYGYDDLNRVTSRADAAEHTVTYGYDAADRVISETLPGGKTYRVAYDANGNRTRLTMPGGAVHTLSYTPIDQDAGYAPPGSAGSTLIYDAEHALTGLLLPGGRQLAFGYDGGGRPTGVASSDATTSYSYADTTDNPSAITRTASGGGAQGLTYRYDGGLLTGATAGGVAQGAYSYAYDNNGLLTGLTLASGADLVTTPITNDADGLLTGVGPFVVTRGGPGGAPDSIGDGTWGRALGYDSLARVAAVTDTVAGAQPYAERVSYDAAGRLVRNVETVAGTTHTYVYAYDSDGQLTDVRHDGTVVEHYVYDADGNRTTRQLGAGAAKTASYDAQDRIVAQGSVTYGVDTDGYLVRRGGDTFSYGSDGALLAATVGGKTVTYAYDGLGRRVGRTDSAGSTGYLYGNPDEPYQITAMRDSSGALTTLTYDEGGLLIAIDRAGARSYVSTDGVGTPRVVTDGSGHVLKAAAYDSFGGVTSDSNPGFALPIGFAGGLVDPTTGLVHFGTRDYDPASGRWTARDPALFNGGQANLYVYAGNNPVQRRDPSGLFSVGGSAYGGPGVGGKISVTTKGVSFCVEAGVGVGGGIEVDPFGGLDNDTNGVLVGAEATVNFAGVANIGVAAQVSPCGAPSVTIKHGVGFLTGSVTHTFADGQTQLGATLNGDANGKPNGFKAEGPDLKLEGKLSGTVCRQITW